MHYLGSKARHAHEIIAFTQSKRKPGQTYVEPFVGGGNMMCRVPSDLGPRIGNDYNFHMVQLLDQLGNHGWVPPETMDEKAWGKIARSKEPKTAGEAAALYAFAATGPTFGSVWFGAWANDYEGKEGTRYRQARDAALKDQPGLVGVKFYDRLNGGGDYRNLTKNQLIPPESVIYCDPPYVGTTGYDGAHETILVGEGSKNEWKAFDFWKWADRLVDQGHTVYVSEYSGPRPGEVWDSIPPSDEEKAVMKACRELQADPASPLEAIIALQDRLRNEFPAQRLKAAEAKAARWDVLWQKEVISDFSATRAERAVDGVPAGKVEVEKLFHRKP